MCETCGCDKPGEGFKIYKPGEEVEAGHTHENENLHSHNHGGHSHTHSHPHPHEHSAEEHSHSHQRTIEVEQDVLLVNNMQAARNKGWFEAKDIFALNLVSSPGSGKTSLLERTIKTIGKELHCYVIEGDQQTDNDARRIQATGAPVVQINTGNACHLDADMVYKAVQQLKPAEKSIMFIENVGNLVCPAMFDLGEAKRVVIFSVTEGEDKPLKYPNMFHSADVCVINKTDLLPYLDFDIKQARDNALKINHHLKFFEVSVKSGEGMDQWLEWLKVSAR
jgi:hydrogenase nickel incorporation protein HypB